MTEYDNMSAAWLIFVSRVSASVQRWHAEDSEEIRCCPRAEDSLRGFALRQVEARILEARNLFERGRSLADVLEVAHCQAAEAATPLRKRQHGAIGMREGKWPEYDRVDDAKDGGGGAETECKRQDRRGREARLSLRLPEGKADVLPELVPPILPREGAIAIGTKASQACFHLRDIAQTRECLLPRGQGINPAVDELSRAKLDVMCELVAYFL